MNDEEKMYINNNFNFNYIIHKSEYVFIPIFTFECILKIIGMGLIFKNKYC